MKYLYILLVIIVIYYIISNLSENYSSSEHFDPSLVPVSSIVTLAKVAQKLVNGGDTLINPGNLHIGMPSAPGNFTVTGNTLLGLSGTKTNIAGITTINNDTIINDNLNVGNGIYIYEGNLALNNGTINLISDGTGGLYLSKTSDISGESNRLTTGPTTVNGRLDVKGPIDTENANISGDLNVKGSSTIDRHSFVKGNVVTGMVVADNRLHIHSNKEDVYLGGKNGVTIGKGGFNGATSGNLKVGGNVNIDGNLNTNELTHDDLMRLKFLLQIYRYNSIIKGALFCNFNTPVVLVGNYGSRIYNRDHSVYPIAVGEYPQIAPPEYNTMPPPFKIIATQDQIKAKIKEEPNNKEWLKYLDTRSMNKISDHDAGRVELITGGLHDQACYVYIYPGFRFEGWTNVNFQNNNNDDSNRPLPLENKTDEIMYYCLHNGLESNDTNIDKHGINLMDNGGTIAPAKINGESVPNLWEQLSSFKVKPISISPSIPPSK